MSVPEQIQQNCWWEAVSGSLFVKCEEERAYNDGPSQFKKLGEA